MEAPQSQITREAFVSFGKRYVLGIEFNRRCEAYNTICSRSPRSRYVGNKHNDNRTDALIDLCVWVYKNLGLKKAVEVMDGEIDWNAKGTLGGMGSKGEFIQHIIALADKK